MKKFDADTHIVAGLAGGVASVNSGTTEGRRVQLEEWDSITIIAVVEAAAAKTQTLSVRQHDAASAGNSKDVEDLRFYVADHATAIPDIVAATDGDSAVGTAAEAALIWVEVTADQLDVSGGFTRVSGRLMRNAGSEAQEGCLVYVMRGGRYAVDPTDQRTVLG